MNSYLAKDSPQRWILQMELQPYHFICKTYEIDCPVLAGDEIFDGLIVDIEYDTITLWFKKNGMRWLAWSEFIGWYKEEYREIVLDLATVEDEFLRWLIYNTVYGPITYRKGEITNG